MALPSNAHNCLVEWYHRRTGNAPPPRAWELVQGGDGIARITKWNNAEPQPDDATVNSFTATADAYVASTIHGDTDQWSKEFRCVLKLIFTLWKVVNPALTAQQFKTQVKNLWDSL